MSSFSIKMAVRIVAHSIVLLQAVHMVASVSNLESYSEYKNPLTIITLFMIFPCLIIMLLSLFCNFYRFLISLDFVPSIFLS